MDGSSVFPTTHFGKSIPAIRQSLKVGLLQRKSPQPRATTRITPFDWPIHSPARASLRVPQLPCLRDRPKNKCHSLSGRKCSSYCWTMPRAHRKRNHLLFIKIADRVAGQCLRRPAEVFFHRNPSLASQLLSQSEIEAREGRQIVRIDRSFPLLHLMSFSKKDS